MKTLNIAIAGSSGRMGRALLEAIARTADLKLAAALERAGSPYLKKDAGELIGAPCNVHITEDLTAALRGSDVLIDFTRPEGTLVHLAACRGKSVKMVIGTTGFSREQKGLRC
jgi:4-hydroxy-tetrahydrodipicolinate reductase